MLWEHGVCLECGSTDTDDHEIVETREGESLTLSYKCRLPAINKVRFVSRQIDVSSKALIESPNIKDEVESRLRQNARDFEERQNRPLHQLTLVVFDCTGDDVYVEPGSGVSDMHIHAAWKGYLVEPIENGS